ncbi:hypothetical protein ACLESO_00605, partial [Pyxidicoccus sp. 3LG]
MHQAIGRFFRSYLAHSTEPTADTLFNLLNALHSLNDRLRKQTGSDLFDCDEFLALKALRNFLHHEAELPSKITVVPLSSGMTDLLFMCLARSEHVNRAFANPRIGAEDRPRMESVIRFYGPVADLNPCVFNCAVKIFEKVERLGVTPKDEPAYEEFKASYEYESQNRLPHLNSFGKLAKGEGRHAQRTSGVHPFGV